MKPVKTTKRKMNKTMKDNQTNNFAFIDNQNLNRGTRSEGWRVDWFKFRQFLAREFDVTRAYMFIGYLDEYRPMYDQLTGYGFTVIFKPTVEIKSQQDSFTKGNVDVELVLQVMQDYNNYDQAVIVSADGDFYSLINYLSQTSKLKRLLIPSSKYSNLLQEFSDLMTHLGYYRQELDHKPASPKKLLVGEKKPSGSAGRKSSPKSPKTVNNKSQVKTKSSSSSK